MNTNLDRLLPLPEIYFEPGRGNYLLQNAQADWMQMPEGSIRRFLKTQGYSGRRDPDTDLSPIDKMLTDYQINASVVYAGPLAGHLKGLEAVCGKRVLVTESPKLIEPVAGDWPLLNSFLHGLLSDPVWDQQILLFGWLKYAIEALQALAIRPGQAMVLAGPSDSGKSLLQKLITLILGGRCAKPYLFITGQTAFNGELFGAEHLIIEDEQPSTDIRARRNFGTFIKEFTANEFHPCHAKHHQIVTLNPFWRLSVSLNDEPENLLILPPLDESLKDKLILLKAHRTELPMPTRTVDERNAFWNVLRAELPHFLFDILRMAIPEGYASQRFGITHFHHPELLQGIDALAPESRLLDIIDAVVFPMPNPKAWKGTATGLERRLRKSSLSYEASRILYFNTACGVYLGRLASKLPDRISSTMSHGNRHWIITPPRTASDSTQTHALPM
jgi:hypothetical protein